MKILIIPDVHGRDFWIEPCSHDFDKIVFLGDYHDPYPYQVSKDTSRHQLRNKLVPFILDNRDKCVCLLGNHDLQYLVGPPICRYDDWHASEIRELLKKMDLKLYYEVKDAERTYLFTHSGVLPNWLDCAKTSLEGFKNMSINNPALQDISPYRGGNSMVGSPIWGDLVEYNGMKHIPEIYQIFGHTQLAIEDGVINEDYACLDCRQAFVLDTDSGYLAKFKNDESKH